MSCTKRKKKTKLPTHTQQYNQVSSYNPSLRDSERPLRLQNDFYHKSLCYQMKVASSPIVVGKVYTKQKTTLIPAQHIKPNITAYVTRRILMPHPRPRPANSPSKQPSLLHLFFVPSESLPLHSSFQTKSALRGLPRTLFDPVAYLIQFSI